MFGKLMLAAVAASGSALLGFGAQAAAFKCADDVRPPLNEFDAAATKGIAQIALDHGAALGEATSGFCRLPDGRGRFVHYKNGSAYWSPETGWQVVFEPFRAYWANTGWEKGWLGYPQSSTIKTYDNLGKTTNFQGGQLIARPPGMEVREVRATEVKIDLPTPPGEAWRITQANARSAGDSHNGSFTWCYDMIADQGVTKGAKFVSTADAAIAMVNDQHGDDGCIMKEENGEKNVNNCRSNYVSQKLGRGRYASSIHLQKGSYVKTFGQGKADALAKIGPNSSWDDRPTAKSGETIGLVGDSGTGAGNDHIHFCVTTAPDDAAAYGALESTPFVFRNYELRVPMFNGPKWIKVAEGRPKAGDVVRRPVGYSGGPAEVKHLSGTYVVHGETVRGSVFLWPADAPLAPGVVTLRAYSAWGEPTSVPIKVKVDQSLGSKPILYEIKGVPNYQNTTIRARYEPTIPAPRWARPIETESVLFTPNGAPGTHIGISLQPKKP